MSHCGGASESEFPWAEFPIEPIAWAGVFKGKELTEGLCGEGDSLPWGKE